MLRRILFAVSVLVSGCAAPSLQTGLATKAQPTARANPVNWPAARSPSAISDRQTEARIKTMLASMTLEQKVGQMIQADISAITPADLMRYPLGSILAGGNSGPYGDERADAAKWHRLVIEYRDASRKSGAGIPVLFGVDAVHGHSNLPGATIFPHNIGLGAANDLASIERIGAATAAEVAGSGIEWTFAPTLAVPQDMRWGRSYEGYAADPTLVAKYATAMTVGLQGLMVAGRPIGPNHVAATAKHFVADGGTAGGKDQGDAQMSENELIARHALGYPAAINAGALTVMASFSSWNGVKLHGNESLLTNVLKDRMGFAGLVVGDWNGHGQVPGCTVTDCPASFKAGLDLAMAPDSWKGLFDSTLREARDGRLPMARIDDAATRVLRVKAKLGLLDSVPVQRGDHAQVGAPQHLALAREAAAKSLVLLKNNNAALPIRPGAKVLVTGPGANNMAMQAGGWTITWQGSDTTAADFPNGQTIGRAIVAAVEDAGGQARISPDGKWTTKPDVAVVVYGEQPYAEFQGDVPNLVFNAKSGEQALIGQLKAEGIRVVSVFLSGRPLFAGPLMNASDAFVAAWLPGTQGNGVADVLVAGRDGKTIRNFTGRLPFAWPNDARSPVADALFRAGYGLDYGRSVKVGAVNEDPRVEPAPARSDEHFFALGQAIAPWRLDIESAITSRAVDLAAQEDAREFAWTAPGAITLYGPSVDLHRQRDEGFALRLDWRIDALGTSPVLLTVAGVTLDISRIVAVGGQTTLRIPLQCFAAGGANLTQVEKPVRIAAGKGFVAALRDARIEGIGEALPCPPVAR